jgi:hypothetical protein
MSRLHEAVDQAQEAATDTENPYPQGMPPTGNVPWLGQAPAPVPRPGAPVTPPPGVEWKEPNAVQRCCVEVLLK